MDTPLLSSEEVEADSESEESDSDSSESLVPELVADVSSTSEVWRLGEGFEVDKDPTSVGELRAGESIASFV